jgi:hypothetical protein
LVVPEGITLDSDVPEGITVDAEPAPAAMPIRLTRPVAEPTKQTIDAYTKQGLTPEDAIADEVTDASTVGRVLDRFGQGLKAGWGAEPLGLSPQSEQWMRDHGLYDDYKGGWSSIFRAINETVMRPTAALLDGAMRSIRAGMYGVAGLVGQTAYEAGLAETPGRAVRDLVMLGDTLLTVGGAMPFGLKPGRLPTERVGPVTAAEEAAIVARVADEAPIPGAVPEPAAPPVAKAPSAQPLRAQATGEGLARPVTESAPLPRDMPEPPANSPVDKAGNINLKYIGGDDFKQIVRDTAESPYYNPKIRGPMTFEQIDDLAAELDLPATKLFERAKGEAWNAEHIDAARNWMVKYTNDVRDLQRKVAAGDNSDKTIVELLQAEARQVAAQEQVAGLADEAGRALVVFRRMKGEIDEAKAMADVIRASGGREAAIDRAHKIGALNDPAAISRTLRGHMHNTGWKDRFLELWYNWGLLASPPTHIANNVSNLAVQLYEALAVRPAQGAIGSLRSLAGAIDPTTVGIGDVLADWAGFIAGAREGAANAWTAFRIERPSGNWALNRDNPQIRAWGSIDEAGKWGGKQIRIPGRLLMASDELFRTIGARRALWTEASTMARAEGHALFSDAYFSRVAEIVSSPTPEMLDRAGKIGTKQVFQAPLGKAAGAVSIAANEYLLLRMQIPFIRTPINIFKYAADQTPLGMLAREARDNLRGVNGAAAQDAQIARMIVGSMFSTAIASLAATGEITGGGPTDPEERAIWSIHHKPYHIRIGGYEYDYKRLLGPLGLLLAIHADANDIAKVAEKGEYDKIAALAGASVMKNLVNQTWMQGPSEMMKALSDPDRFGQRWVQRQVTSLLTPSIMAQAARIEDPYLRDARTIVDAVKARTPGFSKQVAPMRDIFGQYIPLDFPLVSAAQQAADPTVQAFTRLGFFPAKPDRRMGGVELSPEQYDRLQYHTGTMLRVLTDRIVSQPNFESLPPFVQMDQLKAAVEGARRIGAARVQMGDPQLMHDILKKKYDILTKK